MLGRGRGGLEWTRLCRRGGKRRRRVNLTSSCLCRIRLGLLVEVLEWLEKGELTATGETEFDDEEEGQDGVDDGDDAEFHCGGSM